jgi:hypothetical protein
MASSISMDDAKRQQTLRGLVEHHRDAERRGMGSAATATEPRWESKEKVALARYEGTDPEARHRFATLIAVAERGAWAFFLEANDNSTAESFQKRADALFQTVRVGP